MRMVAMAIAFVLVGGTARAQTPEVFAAEAGELIFGTRTTAAAALAALDDRGRADAAASLILALRYGRPVDNRDVDAVLQRLTGATASGWFDWMVWQQGADVRPHAGHHVLQQRVWTTIDPRFAQFFESDVPPRIRLEEIVWGGVKVDGIPALTNPRLLSAAEASYLNDDDRVFGVALGGVARAYPLRIANWHEMVNDVVGGVPVSLAYCTLCNAGILFRTDVAGYEAPLVFGSSGFLYRSNKLMYDTATQSLWNQFTGRPVVGPLAAQDLELEILPVAITSWREWVTRHPKTTVLDIDTGFERDYRPGAAYGEYFASSELMFPARSDADDLAPKAEVFGVRAPGGAAAWPLEAFEGGAVIHDRAGLWDLVLIGDSATRTVRAYRREATERFRRDGAGLVRDDGVRFVVTETALEAANEIRRERVPGHLAYWFAWAGYLGSDGLRATRE